MAVCEGEAKAGSVEWSVAMRVDSERTQDGENDGDLTPQPLASFLLPFPLTPLCR